MAPSEGISSETLLDVLEDEYARDILVETAKGPRSVEELSEACEASPSTIYRRIDRLEELSLVAPEQRLDPEGHHYKVYGARLEAASIVLTPQGFEVEIERVEEDPAGRFTRLYEEFSG